MFKHANVNDTVFTNSNPEALYWAGLIAADGCLITKKAKYRDYNYILLYLAGDDGYHIQRLLDFAESSYTLATRSNAHSQWAKPGAVLRGCAIHNDKIWSWLQSNGVTKNKSKTLKVSDEFAQSVDFWRGVVDGDGSVGLSRNRDLHYPSIALGGSFALMQAFQDFITQHIGNRPKIGTCRSIHRVGLVGLAAQQLVALLYNGNVALPRKAAAANIIKAWAPRKKYLCRARK